MESLKPNMVLGWTFSIDPQSWKILTKACATFSSINVHV